MLEEMSRVRAKSRVAEDWNVRFTGPDGVVDKGVERIVKVHMRDALRYCGAGAEAAVYSLGVTIDGGALQQVVLRAGDPTVGECIAGKLEEVRVGAGHGGLVDSTSKYRWRKASRKKTVEHLTVLVRAMTLSSLPARAWREPCFAKPSVSSLS